MVVVQRGRTSRKPTGGRYKIARGKRKFETGRQPVHTKIGEQKITVLKTKSNSIKMKVLVAKTANVLDPKTKKFTKSVIKTVEECPANRHFVRRNIIVKGTIITTEAGKARVTSRPGQDGTVNAVLVS
ncbi:MAG TPA: 30S ribosomal protein S8e [Candidatus Nanoarchaeia archaeon]|nr:30S ribosomal protein S8e [Candidatus Nanoarchaeia archaeon]